MTDCRWSRRRTRTSSSSPAGVVLRFGWCGQQEMTLDDAAAICALPIVQQAAYVTGDTWRARLRSYMNIALKHFTDAELERLATLPLAAIVPMDPAPVALSTERN